MNLAVSQELRFESAPAAVLQSVRMGTKEIHVVRDDLLPGGTKQRGLTGLLTEYRSTGRRRVAYASPFCGYAQVALSYLCARQEIPCILFCERAPAVPGATGARAPHPFTAQAQAYGAWVILFDTLAEAQAAAREFCAKDPTFHEIPLGFDCAEFNFHYARALSEQWAGLKRRLGREPANLWLPIGSGTLARNFIRVLRDSSTHVQGLDVHVLPDLDPRIANLRLSDRITVWSAHVAFAQPEATKPPFPSNAFYDAKLGPFMARHARSGDIWWNVAG